VPPNPEMSRCHRTQKCLQRLSSIPGRQIGEDGQRLGRVGLMSASSIQGQTAQRGGFTGTGITNQHKAEVSGECGTDAGQGNAARFSGTGLGGRRFQQGERAFETPVVGQGRGGPVSRVHVSGQIDVIEDTFAGFQIGDPPLRASRSAIRRLRYWAVAAGGASKAPAEPRWRTVSRAASCV